MLTKQVIAQTYSLSQKIQEEGVSIKSTDL